MTTFFRKITGLFLLNCILFLGISTYCRQNCTDEKLYNSVPVIIKDSLINYQDIINKMAVEIESLKTQYPQLIDFNFSEDVSLKNLSISYSYKTHKSHVRAGWRSGVPEPDEDGIWFYINFHSPDSDAQIDTQPVMPCMKIGEKIITFLILEGEKTSSLNGKINKILKKYGVVDC